MAVYDIARNRAALDRIIFSIALIRNSRCPKDEYGRLPLFVKEAFSAPMIPPAHPRTPRMASRIPTDAIGTRPREGRNLRIGILPTGPRIADARKYGSDFSGRITTVSGERTK